MDIVAGVLVVEGCEGHQDITSAADIVAGVVIVFSNFGY